MVKYLSRNQERRGTRRLMIWGVAAAIVIAILATVYPWIPGFHETDTHSAATGPHTSQQQGASVAGRTTKPPPNFGGQSERSTTTGRGQEIAGSATENLNLNSAQRDAINKFASSQPHQQGGNFNFTIAVGVSVPHQVQLHDMPSSLASQLPSYQGDQYFLTNNQFVIVEKNSRRIVAIVPTA